ncbi:MAG: hypothetical protein KF730_07090 [Sphingomonas sp.]|uniref:hypothetical protein n=1 Tax=Sphingomonas sp. TaxID=28214 RepID=UPI0025CFEBAF|nr:hypothetical protein [Sphingomonas sp.]MBX3564326.1 hypothetical protein [Sphingomonas sp.]
MNSPAPSITDHLVVAIRAYAAPTIHTYETLTGKPRRKASKRAASPWVVIFDTETTSDAAQSLRFGTFQIRHNGERYREGIFYAPDGVNAAELRTLADYADQHGLELLTRDEFAVDILYTFGYRSRGTIVGFNLPFDISRIALRHEPARGDMRGGFSFTLSEDRFHPNVRVKHLSQSAAFIKFAAPSKQLDGNTDRKHGRKTPFNSGHFLDVKTLAKALLSRSFSLASLCDHLGTKDKKLAAVDFAGPVTPEMVCYAVRDVEATWQCYADLIVRFDRLELEGARPDKILSEASIGKAYLRGMGIRSWQKIQPDFPPQMLANIMGSYFGGRAEVRIRRELRQVIHCDFLSMYPTVCTLMNLWPFVRGEGMAWRDSTDETRALLDGIDIAALQSPEFWPRLTTIVRVLPDADIFPVRASYTPKATPTTGTNLLTGDVPLWLTLAECISSKLLSGKAPKVIEAVTFSAGSAQTDLSAINIQGNAAYRVDPNQADFFKRVIELRNDTKIRRDAATGAEYDRLDTEQNALKIAANSTSYGIFVEVNVEDLPDARMTTVHASTCDRFTFRIDKNERPGPFFHPLLATLICGAARLMLAITEQLVTKQGLDWAFCDTDSMAIARPEPLDPDEFAARVQSVVDWFAELNPYDFDGSILQIEKVNTALDKSGPAPLYCWAISAKRYALFNLAEDGTPIMRKISAHGLGHLLAPYDASTPAPNIPLPHSSVLTDGVEHWQHDLWWKIVSAAVSGDPDEIDLHFHDAMVGPAMSQYAATTPELLRWFKGYNQPLKPRDRVKPFNFLLAMIANAIDTGEGMIAADAKPSRRKIKDCRPVSPYTKDRSRAAELVFDRETGKPVSKDRLATYADALAQYHIHPEAKFLNGNYGDRGTTRRRHIRMTATRHIGKEAHDLERQAYIGLEPSAAPTYGISGIDRGELVANVTALIDTIGTAKTVTALATNATRLQRFISGKASRSDQAFSQSILARLPVAQTLAERVSFQRQAEIQALREDIERDGRNVTARRLGIDPSNLGRMLRKAGIREASSEYLSSHVHDDKP